MPGNALSTDYYFPWYDGQGMQTWLAVANTGAPAIQTVRGLSGVSAITAGAWHTCAIAAGNTVKCWGANGSGQVGDNSSQMRTSPASAQLADVVTYARTYGDTDHVHAVTSADGNSYTYDANGNMITRVIGTDAYQLLYDAENRLVEVKKNNASIATFVYDGDGNRVRSTINGVTTTFVENYYEVSGGAVTKYYYFGSQRVAMRRGSAATPRAMNVAPQTKPGRPSKTCQVHCYA